MSLLTELAAKHKVTILVEGEPSPFVLSKVTLPHLDENAPLKTTLATLASLYDYEVVSYRSLYLFQKKYTYPQDIPCVTTEECATACRNLRKIVWNVLGSPYELNNSTSKDGLKFLLRSLTQAQKESLKQQGFLRFRPDLNVAQKQELQKILFYEYIQPIAHAAQHGAIVYRKTRFVEFALDNELYYGFFLTNEMEQRPDPYSVPIMQIRLEEGIQNTATPVPEMTPEDKISLCITLRELAQRLTDEALPDESKREKVKTEVAYLTVAPVFQVEETLVKKPVIVFGKEHNPGHEIWRGVAKLYGLRFEQIVSTNIFRVSQHPLSVSKETAFVQDTILNTIPEPFRRAFRFLEMQQAVKAGLDANGYYRNEDFPKTSDKIEEHHSKLSAEARWRLLKTVQEQVGTNKERRIPFDVLSFEEDSCFATDRFAAVAYALLFVRFRVPTYLSRFEDLCLVISQPKPDEKGENFVMIGLHLNNGVNNSPGQLLIGFRDTEKAFQ